MAKYDVDEARDVVGLRIGSGLTPQAVLLDAHRELVEAIVSLDGTAGLSIKRDSSDADAVAISKGRQGVFILWEFNPIENRGVHVVIGKNGVRSAILLNFNAARELFEGRTDDDYCVQTPGQRRAKRSAVAVLLEAAMSHL